MTAAISVRLPDSSASLLDDVARQLKLSKTDVIIQGIETIHSSLLDRKVTYLTDKQFEEALDFLSREPSKEAKERLSATLSKPYPWEIR